MMMMKCNKAWLIIFFSVFNLISVFSQQKELVIGWAEFDTTLIPQDRFSEYKTAATLLPIQFKKNLKHINKRLLSNDEIYKLIQIQIDAELEVAKKKVSDARAKRDNIIITQKNIAKQKADLYTAENNLKKAEQDFKDMLYSIPVKKEALFKKNVLSSSIPIKPSSNNPDEILLPPTTNPRLTCSEKKIDLLVYGSFELIEGFLFIKVSFYSAPLDKILWTESDYAAIDGLEDFIKMFSRPLSEAILGCSYTYVTLKIEPESADIFIDDILDNNKSYIYFENGNHKLEAKADGFENFSTTFITELGNDVSIDVDMTRLQSKSIIVTSKTEDALIYESGKVIGKTPAEIEGVPFSRVLRIVKEKKDDVLLVISPNSDKTNFEITFQNTDGKTYDERFDEKKIAFYKSLGWFILSLPATAIFGGTFQTYYNTFKFTNPVYLTEEAYKRLVTGYYVSEALFITSAVISAGLAGYSIYRLVKYLRNL